MHTKISLSGHKRLAQAAVALAAALGAGIPAHAALGEFPLTGANEHVKASSNVAPKLTVFAQASGAATQATGFTINTVTLDSGTTVKEYVATATNKVFAVVWQGPAIPNLKEVLGESFNAYVSAPVGASGVRLGGVSSRSYSANGLVVRSHGVPGHFAGYAYLSASFPQGVTLQTLRQAQ